MKKTQNIIVGKYFFIMVIFFSIQCSDAQPSNEIPITSKSEEAIKLFIEGREMFENLNIEQADKLFDKAIILDDKFAQAYYYRATSESGYIARHKFLSKAFDLIDKVSQGEKHLILYQAAFFENNNKKAEKELDELLRLYPNDKRVQNMAGVYYQYVIKNYKKALAHLNNGVTLDPNYAPNYNILGYLHKSMENYSGAEKAFQKYINLIPNEANPYDSYAELLLHKGNYAESITNYEKAYKLDPEFVNALRGIANNYILMGDYNKANEYNKMYFDEATDIYDKISSLYQKATSYLYEGKVNEAIELMQERADFAQVNGALNYVIISLGSAGFILDEMGRYDEADLYYKKAGDFINVAELSDSDRNYYKMGLVLDICCHNILRGKITESEEVNSVCSEAINLRDNPRDKEFLNQILGFLEAKKGEYKEALKYYSEADKESPYTWYHEALAYEKSGKDDKAKKLFDKIVNWNNNGLDLAVVRNKAIKKLNEY